MEAVVSRIRCPKCSVVLEPKEITGGWCDRCGKKLPDEFLAAARAAMTAGVQTAPAVPGMYGVVPRRSKRPLRGLVFFVLLVLGIVSFVLYSRFQPDVKITVDNSGTGTDDEVILSVDGSETRVASHRVGSIECRAGSRHIIASRGGRVTFDQVKDLIGRRDHPRNYLLDPDATHRYWIRTVDYGVSVPKFNTYYSEIDHYWQIADQITRVPPGRLD
jgi:hypothetical protein